MSAKAKNAAQERRKKEKRARKAAEQAKYAAWAAAGSNKKSKRNVLKNQRSAGIRNTRHAELFCHNIGCRQCFPRAPAKVSTDTHIAVIRSNKNGNVKFSLLGMTVEDVMSEIVSDWH